MSVTYKRDVVARDRDETETFGFQAETETETFPHFAEIETRPRHLKNTSRDRLETETSRPRLQLWRRLSVALMGVHTYSLELNI